MSSSSEDAAVAELARRILRSNGLMITHNGQLTDQIEQLSSELSDRAPKIVFGINGKISDVKEIFFEINNSEDGMISLKPPNSLDIVWIRGGANMWSKLTRKIVELGSAGYPGCVGCAGPAASEPWNEEASRNEI
jgi:hypothetical protein|tara:strand:+ start:1686 stop:2090 length:405 start_codon:yes stop_codon:yes gene_type:complete